ncbi:MAG: hypothetical protein CL512_05955 [Actinobacteria bacterium]|jgi:hypothetical protein|nr:hypothetical protein [Actinomycetota bacterium]|tara:strand:+ start:437 stop:757 length:321 start_codon:yes stop_codon:yes gene_type:complete
MKNLFLILIIFSLSGCWGGVKYNVPKAPPNNPPVEVKPVDFEVIDANDDGNISRSEAESYNAIVEKKSSEYDVSIVLYYFAMLMGLMFLVCLSPWLWREVRSRWVK